MTPVIHFASRQDAAEPVHHGPALCGAGKSTRTAGDQFVAGDWSFVSCRNCHRILRATNAREQGEEQDLDRRLRTFVLTRIRDDQQAWDLCWPLTDAYGAPGHMPPQGMDWSGFRDSSDAAIRRMATALGIGWRASWVQKEKD